MCRTRVGLHEGKHHNRWWGCRPSTMHEVFHFLVLTMLKSWPQDSTTPEKWFLQADVYSFGVTLWELLSRKRPYKGMDPYQIQASSKTRRLASRAILAHGRPESCTEALSCMRSRPLHHQSPGSAVAALGSSTPCYAHCPRCCIRLMPTRACPHADSEHIESGGTEAAASQGAGGA